MDTRIFLYVAVMAGVTYLIRMLPLVAFRGKIKNRFFKTFLYYVPYAVLGAMTFPAILYSTGGIYSALAGLIVAVVLAFLQQKLLTVAFSACVAAFLVQFLIG